MSFAAPSQWRTGPEVELSPQIQVCMKGSAVMSGMADGRKRSPATAALPGPPCAGEAATATAAATAAATTAEAIISTCLMNSVGVRTDLASAWLWGVACFR